MKGFRMSIVFKRDVHLVDADAEDGRVNDAGVGDVSAITPCTDNTNEDLDEDNASVSQR